jgi:hypothetical protein
MTPETMLNNAHERLRLAGWRGRRWRSQNNVPIITISTGSLSVCNMVWLGKSKTFRIFFPINWTSSKNTPFVPTTHRSIHQSRIDFKTIDEVNDWLCSLLKREPGLMEVWLSDETLKG